MEVITSLYIVKGRMVLVVENPKNTKWVILGKIEPI